MTYIIYIKYWDVTLLPPSKARYVLAIMIKQGVEPSLMDGYFLVKEVHKAKHVFNTIARRGVALDVHSYNIMINGLCKNKMVDEAINLFKEIWFLIL